MTLEQCTREELLFIINSINPHIETALPVLLQRVAIDRNCRLRNDAEKFHAIAECEFNKYLDAVRPYMDGKCLTFIPIAIMDKAKQHYHNYEQAKAREVEAVSNMVVM